MCRGLCFSYLHNSESVGVLGSLPTRNVQWRLLQQYMFRGLCVSCLHNPKSVGVHNSLATRMCSKKCATQAASIVYMICSPWYVLVEFVWDLVGHILFSGVYTALYIGDCLFVVL